MIFKKHFNPDAKEWLQICTSGWPWERSQAFVWFSLGFNLFYSYPSPQIQETRTLCISLSLIIEVNIWIILKKEPVYKEALRYPQDTSQSYLMGSQDMEEIKTLFKNPASSGYQFKELPILTAHREIMRIRQLAPNEITNQQILNWYFRDRHPVTFEKLDEE